MKPLARRLANLESRLPPREAPGRMVTREEMAPEVVAMMDAADWDVDRLSLAELDLLEADVRRFLV